MGSERIVISGIFLRLYRLTTSNNTALSGLDYVAPSPSIVISPSDGTMKEIIIEIKDDNLFEVTESFIVNLSSSDISVNIGTPSSAHVFIVDDDGKATCCVGKGRK